MATSKRKKRTSSALAGTLSAFNPETEQKVSAVSTILSTDSAIQQDDDSAIQKNDDSAIQQDDDLAIQKDDDSAIQKDDDSAIQKDDDSEAKFTPKIETRLKQVSNRVIQYLGGEDVSTEQLTAWLETLNKNLTARQIMQQWLDNWSTEELTQFYQHWSTYCTGLGFELTWVINQNLTGAPLQKGLQQTALAYISLYQQSLDQQSGIANFRQYEDWRSNVSKAHYQSLNQTLFIQLSHQDLIPPPPVEIYCADEQTRIAYIHEALLKAADEHLAELLKALIEALS